MTRYALIAFTFLAASLGASAAQADGFYVSVAGSAVFRNTLTQDFSSATDPFGNRAFNGDVAVPYRQSETYHYKAGGEGDIAGGYRFGLGRFGALRSEIEFSFRDYQLGASSVRSLPGQIYGAVYNGAISTVRGDDQLRYAGTANAFYDLPQLGFATPYVGAGVGYQQGVQTPGERLHAYEFYNGPSGAVIYGPPGATGGGTYLQRIASSDGGQGTWLVEGGISLPLTARLSLTPAYRYTQGFHGHDGVNVMRVGLRYGF